MGWSLPRPGAAGAERQISSKVRSTTLEWHWYKRKNSSGGGRFFKLKDTAAPQAEAGHPRVSVLPQLLT